MMLDEMNVHFEDGDVLLKKVMFGDNEKLRGVIDEFETWFDFTEAATNGKL